MSCGVGCRCGSDLAWLWLWCRPAGIALIRSLAWELPYPHASGAALKRQKPKKKKKTSLYSHQLHIFPTFESVYINMKAGVVPVLRSWCEDEMN